MDRCKVTYLIGVGSSTICVNFNLSQSSSSRDEWYSVSLIKTIPFYLSGFNKTKYLRRFFVIYIFFLSFKIWLLSKSIKLNGSALHEYLVPSVWECVSLQRFYLPISSQTDSVVAIISLVFWWVASPWFN